jgi:hypothetical protein
MHLLKGHMLCFILICAHGLLPTCYQLQDVEDGQGDQYVWRCKERSNEGGGWTNMSRPVGLRLKKSDKHPATIPNEPRKWFTPFKSRFNDLRSWCNDRACWRHTVAAQFPPLAYGNCLPYLMMTFDVDAFTRIMRRGVFRRSREF